MFTAYVQFEDIYSELKTYEQYSVDMLGSFGYL